MKMFSRSACARYLQVRRFIELETDSKIHFTVISVRVGSLCPVSLGAGDWHFLSSFPLVILTRSSPPLTALEHFLLFRSS